MQFIIYLVMFLENLSESSKIQLLYKNMQAEIKIF